MVIKTKRDEVRVDIAANRELGHVVYHLVRGRMLQAGLDIPHTNMGNLAQALNVCVAALEKAINELYRGNAKNLEKFDIEAPWVKAALNFDPKIMLMMHTTIAMTFFSMLDPDGPGGLGLIPFTNEYFQRSNFELMDEEEMDRLAHRILSLQARQQKPGTLGAAGNALMQAAMRPFKKTRVPSGTPAAKRRREFTRKVERCCIRVEELRALADRKAEGTLLGEMITEELRASRKASAIDDVEEFWKEFDLFFGCTRLINT
jgi:hypothetical protein